MTLLSDFYALVKDEANKGNRLDAQIPTRVAMAVQRGERKYSLKYLERFVTLTLDPLAAEPRAVAFPANNGLKSINFMRYLHCGRYRDLPQVDPTDVVRDSGCWPTGYWLDGVNYIWFDNTVKESLSVELSYNTYSVWPPTDGTHWLLTCAQDWLLADTMMLLSTVAKEPTWMDKYKDMKSEAEAGLFTADNELRNNDRDYIMTAREPYYPSHRGRYPGDDGV